MKLKLTKADFFIWPVAITGVLTLAMLLATVFGLAAQFDNASRQREEMLVANGVSGRMDEVARMVVPQVMWDDAVRNLDNRFDRAWAENNIGQFLGQTDGFDASFVLDRANQPLFGANQSGADGTARYADYAARAGAVVAAVRAEEAHRGPLAAPRAGAQILAPPLQHSTITHVNGKLAILTATLVQPDFGTAMPRNARAPIVVTVMSIDGPFLQAFAHRFMLQGLHVHEGPPETAVGAHVALHSTDNSYVATLAWTPQRPGVAMLHRMVMPMLLVIGVLSVVVLLLYIRGRRMAQGLIASEARASHLAYYDPLTGLPNRVLFFDRLGLALDQMRRNGQTVAVHCIDLDRFKEVNDTFGHQVGDELIKEAARRMAAQCRASDTFCRLSGDEFAIVQVSASPANAAALAERLVQATAEPFELADSRLYVGCSIGVSMVDEHLVDPAEALRQADLALYRAKANGKNQYCFFEIEMDAAVKTRRLLEADLREGLKRGELEMVYQPQVNSRNVMVGVEALVRWKHPVRGYVAPSFFVPIAEECGLIAELGMFTLRRAFEDSRRWPHLKVAINVSANQVRLADFVTRIADLVSECGVDPRRFELEITEGILLGDDPDTHDTLKRLRNLGFSLALDDFGTGYSSLSYLQRYPITKIKIDRTFIANLGVDAEADAVVGAIVKLARALNLSVIAEGVETSDQRERLANAGCAEIQGFLFSKPVGATEIDSIHARPHAANAA